MAQTRRRFIAGLAGAGLAAAAGRLVPFAQASIEDFGFPDGRRLHRGDSSVGAALRDARRNRRVLDPTSATAPPPSADLGQIGPLLRSRFTDLPRHFVFEYYAWYETDPWGHWDEGGRRPPADLATRYVPALGPYDSRSRGIVEQHARWLAESGAGAIDLSWWGPGSTPDRAAHLVMDVMRDHGIKVAFHLEPYSDRHGYDYARDLLYLVKEFGDRRRWDAFLLLRDADGKTGPVFKSFRTILPLEVTDCHGVVSRVPDYTPDAVWHEQTDRVRASLAGEFDHVSLLADSLDWERTSRGGFDGIAIYDNYVGPETWSTAARECQARDLLFSFNINPGADGYQLRDVAPGSCYVPPRFEPFGDRLDWDRPGTAERARRFSTARIRESAATTLALQTDGALTNHRRGFLLVYVNSFNEWHEGHQFEPMKDASDLTGAERALGYRNPIDGRYRIEALRSALAPVLGR